MEQRQAVVGVESDIAKKKNKRGGYMALRNNVYDTKLELWHILKPLEMFLVDIIIDKTIKWRQKEAKITIEDLVERTKQRSDYIYIALKELESKGVIVRRKTKHDLFIGLNEEFFGELLIKKHEDALQARKSKIKIVVDNSKNKTENKADLHLNSVQSPPDSSLVYTGFKSEKVRQDNDIIKESGSLNTFFKDISLKTLLKDSQKQQKPKESFTLSGDQKQRQIRWLKETDGRVPFNEWEDRMKA